MQSLYISTILYYWKFLQNILQKLIPILCVFLAIFLLSACSPKFSNVELPIENLKKFSEEGVIQIENKWWLSLQDKKLNILIDTALQSNLNLAATWQRFMAARAVLKREKSNKWPQIDASAQTAENFPVNDFRGGENTQLRLSTTYEIDLWGRIRTAVQAENYRAEASLFDYRTAAISLSAEVATTWYQLVAARKQLQITEQQIAVNEDIIQLIRSRFVGGQIRGVDILRQAQLLESTREQQIIFSTTVQLLQNQLKVLLGKQPQEEFDLKGADFPELTALPKSGLPLELIRRRPDIQQSYAFLLAADRDMASAISAKYPRLSINARGAITI